MSEQWIHDFIDTRVLDDRFEVEEFFDFTAVIMSCDVPIFRNLQSPWKLEFEFDQNNHFKWKAVEHEDEDDPHGICVLEGNLKIAKSEYPKRWYPDRLSEDEDAVDFVKAVFPESDVDQLIPERNVFQIDDEMIDFDRMECSSGYMYIEFSATS
jgi:hypothetical protein